MLVFVVQAFGKAITNNIISTVIKNKSSVSGICSVLLLLKQVGKTALEAELRQGSLAVIKMRFFLTIIIIFLVIQCSGQSASLKEIRLKPNSKYYNPKETTIIFPIVLTKNSKVDALINSQIKEEVFLPDSANQNLKSLLNEHINDYGLINMSYEVNYNRLAILSLSIYFEGCGAHCSSSNIYFNFDLSTGKKVSVDEIFLKDKIDSFKTIVQSDKKNSLTKYKLEEKNALLNNEIDSTTYDWAISQVDENCINQFSIDQFAISSNSIEIFDPCDLPHAIRSQTPAIELKYPYNRISQFLNPKFKRILK